MHSINNMPPLKDSEFRRSGMQCIMSQFVFDFQFTGLSADHYLSYFFASPSGKMILFTKKKITMETPPFRTVVPML